MLKYFEIISASVGRPTTWPTIGGLNHVYFNKIRNIFILTKAIGRSLLTFI